ncbi:MAG: class I SAM-dependent methyltransferase [Patescibacteria group bacterium]
MKKEFSQIYQDKVWFGGSGSGSLPENTRAYRDFLQEYLKTHDVHRVLDIGCGDWQSSHLLDWSGIDYLGVDVVESVVKENQKAWGSDHIAFQVVDDLAHNLPDADLVLIKDVFQHWPNQAILDFLPRLQKYPHVLITNTILGERCNEDIFVGDFRSVDLTKPPFFASANELLRYESFRPIKKVYETKAVIELVR